METKLNGQTNGKTKGGKKINGINGINGHALTPRRGTPQAAKAGPNFFSHIFSIAARLFTWYSIFTLLFRCPATLDACDDASPKICKGYFQVKQSVTPHLSPYYDTYAAPYVEAAKPYYDTVDRVVITPSRTYAVKYGGPQLKKAQALGLAQWEKNVQPQLLKYQGIAKSQYDQTIAPHVSKVSTVVAPYYGIARANALQTYHEILLPSYLFVQPYALHGYRLASSFTTSTAVPSTLWAWNKTYVFLDTTVWPHVRDVYVAKVEPQLARITDRLSRYKEIKPKTAVEVETQAAKSTFAKPSTSISSSTASVKTTPKNFVPESTAIPVSTKTAEPAAEVPVDETPSPSTKEEIRELAAKTVAEDLELWQRKFTTAADERASEIEERVEEVCKRIIKEEARGKGKSLVVDLGKTVREELAGLRKSISTILEQHKDSQDSDNFEEEVAAAVRGAGLKIKSKAQAIRTWRERFEAEVENAVTTVAQEHIMIIEGIRDHALQKIGMKWAWTDGITYKHWQKFHQLRHRFDEWIDELKQLVITHPALAEVQATGNEIESEGMAIAGEAAQELGTLKQVASWKALAGDFSDDFDPSTMKLAAEIAQKKAAEAAEAVKSAATDVHEGVHSVANKLEDNVESINGAFSEGVLSVHASKSTSGTILETDADETITTSPSKSDPDHVETSAVPPLESLTSEPTHSATDLASDSVIAETAIIADNATGVAESINPLPTSIPVDGPEQIEEDIFASPENVAASMESSTTTVKSVMFGAAAQSVPSRQPVLDDDIISSISSAASVVQSDVGHTITSAAQSAYTAAIAQAADKYSRAMSAVSAQISGEPKPIHEELLSSVSSAYFGAVASANSRLGEALTAASTGIHGTPTTKWMSEVPTLPAVDWENVQSIAQHNLQDAVNWASEQYGSAKAAIGVAEPTPSTASQRYEKLLDQAKHNYYAGLGVAHARYSEFLSAASTAVSSITATPAPTNAQESASSVASVAGASVSAAVSAASGAAASVASSVGGAASVAGDSVVENWDFVVSQVSSKIYGAPIPTPWYENLYGAAGDYASQANDYAASATDAAAGYASNRGDFAADSVSSATAVAGDYAESASLVAASQYSVVSSIVSELVVGKEPTFSESIYSRLGAVYISASATVSSAASEVTVSASSVASVASDSITSAAGKVKEKVDHLKDEL